MKHNWEYKRLGDIATFVNGYAFKPTEWLEHGYPIIRIQNLNNLNAEYNYSKGDIPERYFVSKGDLLISWSASLGAYIWSGEKAVLNQHIFKVVFDKYNIAKFYLKYFVDYSLPLLASKTHGATMKHITKPLFDAIPIPVPPMEVQERIVAELNKINEVIEDCRELLRNLDALAQSLFYDTFGDPVTNPKGWQTFLIKDILALKAGKAIKASELIGNPKTGYFPCYGGNGLRGYIDKASHIGTYNIIGRQGALCGNITLVTGEFYATEHAVVVRTLKEMSQRWLFYQLTILNLNQYAKGVAQPGLSVSVINELKIPVPPLPLQQEFAERVEKIEAQKKAVEDTITEMQTLLDSRMDYWFN